MRFGLSLRQKGTLAMNLKVNPPPWGIIFIGIGASKNYHFKMGPITGLNLLKLQ